jgi:hypothetical protein
MNRVAVESTILASAGYAPDRFLLDLEFRDGTLYRFWDVPALCFQQLMASESKGAFFNRHIRNRFRYQIVTEIRAEN